MLEREGGDSPSPEDEIDGGLSIDEVMKIMKILNVHCLQNLHVTSLNVHGQKFHEKLSLMCLCVNRFWQEHV